MDVLPVGAVMTLPEIEAVLQELSELEAKAARLDAKRKKLKERMTNKQARVMEYMAANQLSLFATNNWQASVTRYKKKRFSVADFKESHPKMYAKYVKEVEGVAFAFHAVK